MTQDAASASGPRTIDLLDHGYVRLVESWGSDERIVEAASMSTDKGFQGWGGKQRCSNCGGAGEHVFDNGIPRTKCSECAGSGKVVLPPGDEKLLRYLWDHKYATPFEMAGLTIEVQAPIFVFREWHRHRTQSYNELSARYTALPDLFYVPSVERLMAAKQGTTNKQGSEGGFTIQQARVFQEWLRAGYEDSRTRYDNMLRSNVAKEVARLVIPVSQYSRMRASANLRNWLAFLTLRMAPNAQWEIQQYANAVASLVEQNFPRTYALFAEGEAT